MKFDKPKKKRDVPLYLLSYRQNGRGGWIDSVPVYDPKVVKRDQLYYGRMYGEANVKVEVVDKMGYRRRPDNRQEYEYSDDE